MISSLSLSDFIERGLKPRDIAVYFALKARANKTGQCDPSYETIAKDAGISKNTVGPAITALETEGFIRVKNRTSAKDTRPSNEYTLTEYKNWDKSSQKLVSNITNPYGFIKKDLSSLEDRLANFEPSKANKDLYDKLIGKGQFRAYVARFKNNCLRGGYNYNCLETGLNKFIENTAQREASKKGPVKPTEAPKQPIQAIEPDEPLQGFTDDQRAIWDTLSKSLSDKVGDRNVIAKNLANLKLIERRNRLVIEATSGAGWAINDLLSKNAGFAGEVCAT